MKLHNSKLLIFLTSCHNRKFPMRIGDDEEAWTGDEVSQQELLNSSYSLLLAGNSLGGRLTIRRHRLVMNFHNSKFWICSAVFCLQEGLCEGPLSLASWQDAHGGDIPGSTPDCCNSQMFSPCIAIHKTPCITVHQMHVRDSRLHMTHPCSMQLLSLQTPVGQWPDCFPTYRA
jgi:hypothetical protein